jgi:hypothetical protein
VSSRAEILIVSVVTFYESSAAFSFAESNEGHASNQPGRTFHVTSEPRTKIIESLAGESLFRFAIKSSSLLFRIENQQASVIASAAKRCLLLKSGAAEVILSTKTRLNFFSVS